MNLKNIKDKNKKKISRRKMKKKFNRVNTKLKYLSEITNIF